MTLDQLYLWHREQQERFADLAENNKANLATVYKASLKRTYETRADFHSRAAVLLKMLRTSMGPARTWREIIGVPASVRDMPSVRIAFRRRAAAVHPDKGGTHEAMAELNLALAAAEKELNG